MEASQKIDFTRNHGVVYGHPEAAYEQNNALYGANGYLLPPEKPKKVSKLAQTMIERDEVAEEVEVETIEREYSESEQWLKDLLGNSPMSKTNVYKVVNQKEQSWAAIKAAAESLGVSIYTQGRVEMWKLVGA